METCLLCLEAPRDFNSYIPINSQRWWQSDVPGIVEKHFWSIDDLPNTLGICILCWSKLNEFHIFYQNIEEAHRRIASLSKKNNFTNCCMETGIFQTSAAQVGKYKLLSNRQSTFKVEDIKIEDSFGEYEHIICEPSTRTIDQITPNSTLIAKRKRGRPRKQENIHEMLVQKPKGKRGRPRKDPKEDIVHQCNYTKELETAPQCDFITTIGNINPPKKKGRGRPRKIQKNENCNRTKVNNELSASGCDMVSVNEYSQIEELINDKFSNETVNIENKKRKIIPQMMKRKRIQQHKALMRNYIATSVRCMKFLKK